MCLMAEEPQPRPHQSGIGYSRVLADRFCDGKDIVSRKEVALVGVVRKKNSMRPRGSHLIEELLEKLVALSSLQFCFCHGV